MLTDDALAVGQVAVLVLRRDAGARVATHEPVPARTRARGGDHRPDTDRSVAAADLVPVRDRAVDPDVLGLLDGQVGHGRGRSGTGGPLGPGEGVLREGDEAQHASAGSHGCAVVNGALETRAGSRRRTRDIDIGQLREAIGVGHVQLGAELGAPGVGTLREVVDHEVVVVVLRLQGVRLQSAGGAFGRGSALAPVLLGNGGGRCRLDGDGVQGAPFTLVVGLAEVLHDQIRRVRAADLDVRDVVVGERDVGRGVGLRRNERHGSERCECDQCLGPFLHWFPPRGVWV